MLNVVNKAELQFKPIKEIGAEGKNSTVYLAEDLQLKAQLVVKKIAKADIKDPAQYFSESSILHKTEHPNVVPAYWGCQDADFVYIGMPYYVNGSLKKMMGKKFLTVREIIRYGIQFLSGLHNIHSKGLIHFDIKPDNILLSNSDAAMVSDFGLAKFMNAGGEAVPIGVYTPTIPPEMIAGGKIFDLQFDIYQTGLTLYRMCVGDSEYSRQFSIFADPAGFKAAEFAKAVMAEKFPDRKSFPAHIPKPLQNIVLKCIKVDKAKRYSSVLEITNALAKLNGDELDWRYTIDAAGKQKWEHATSNRKLYIEYDVAGVANAQKAGQSGKFAKVKGFCGAMLPARIVDFFKEAK
jgi:eukaryotic-like serine/threonine-protein kinase